MALPRCVDCTTTDVRTGNHLVSTRLVLCERCKAELLAGSAEGRSWNSQVARRCLERFYPLILAAILRYTHKEILDIVLRVLDQSFS